MMQAKGVSNVHGERGSALYPYLRNIKFFRGGYKGEGKVV